MSNICEFPCHDQRYDQASVWIAKLDNGLSAADKQALQEWLAADQKNATELLRMAKLWDDMSVLSRLSELFPKPATSPARSQRIRWSAAASIVIALLAGAWTAIALIPGAALEVRQVVIEKAPKTVYATAIGEQSTVDLTDGSVVVLNTNSLIDVQFTDSNRLLQLVRGEIHVRVHRDKLRPFSVKAGDKIVKAIGTAFTVEMVTDQRIELIVTEGKVVVGVPQDPQLVMDDVASDIEVSSSVTVAAGEEIILDVNQEEIRQISAEEIDVKLSWRHGRLVFRGESLEDAVAEIGRYTTVKFVILDEDLKKVRIAGMFKAGDVEGLLTTLRENFDISHTLTGDGKILLTSL